MDCKRIFCSLLILFSSYSFAAQKIIAIDGVSGFVGSTLAKDLADQNLRLGVHHYTSLEPPAPNVFVGNICDPAYLKTFLKNVDVYYQMAGISSVNTKHSLEEYILTNSIAPYLASRINKSMTIVTFSSAYVYDIEESDAINSWVTKLITHTRAIFDNKQITQDFIAADLHKFMLSNPPPNLRPTQFYAFSKYLSEKLLFKSNRSRQGHIYIIRPALIIGAGIQNKHGESLVNGMLQALYARDAYYEVWDRTNYFTPLEKLKQMIFHIANSEDEFAKFGIFDSGWVAMNQHTFAKKLCNLSRQRPRNLELVAETGIARKMAIFKDARLEAYYPVANDIDESITDMIQNYQE